MAKTAVRSARTPRRRPVARSRRRAPTRVDVDEELLHRVLPTIKMLRAYCRVRCEGLHHLPAGPALIAANHTGWLGLDYSNLAMTVHDATGRIVRGVVHPMWFRTPKVAGLARRLGLMPADKGILGQALREGNLVVIFPEAERGAFKPTVDSQYELQEFRRGFVRAAMNVGVPIIPAAILGGEEANPVLRTMTWTDRLFRLPLPVPKGILPRPVKWRISFLSPVYMEDYSKRDAEDRDLVVQVAESIRERIQRELRIQLKRRGHKYL